MAEFVIPLIASPQRFSISLNGVPYVMTVRWCTAASCWILDIADEDDVPILSGVPIITGADLLSQYEYLGIGGGLEARTEAEPDAVPTFENLGLESHLVFITP